MKAWNVAVLEDAFRQLTPAQKARLDLHRLRKTRICCGNDYGTFVTEKGDGG